MDEAAPDMIATAPEPTSTNEIPAPEPEPAEIHSEAELLECVRQSAARYDPYRRLAYSTVSPARIKHAAFVAQRLLRSHLRYLQHTPQGRRQHSAEVHAILDGTNPATLTLALAILDLAFIALPPGTQD